MTPKPAAPVAVDPANPLAAGLISAFACAEPGGASTADSVQAGKSIACATAADKSLGILKRAASVGDVVALPISLAGGTIPSFSVSTRFVAGGNYLGSNLQALSVLTADGVALATLGRNVGTPHFALSNYRSGSLVEDVTYAVTAAGPVDVTYTLTHDSASGVTSLYNGAKLVGTTKLDSPRNNSVAWKPLTGEYGGGADVGTAYAYCWARCLSAGEAASLAADPFTMWTAAKAAPGMTTAPTTTAGTGATPTPTATPPVPMDTTDVGQLAVAVRREFDANSQVLPQVLAALKQILAKLQ